MSEPSEITALELVGLRLYVNATIGTKEHANAVKLLKEATAKWTAKWKIKCPHCGKLMAK